MLPKRREQDVELYHSVSTAGMKVATRTVEVRMEAYTTGLTKEQPRRSQPTKVSSVLSDGLKANSSPDLLTVSRSGKLQEECHQCKIKGTTLTVLRSELLITCKDRLS